MLRLGICLLVMMPTAAWAADSAEFGDCLFCIVVLVLLAAIPATGFGYVLQSYMRLRIAAVVLFALIAFVPGLYLLTDGPVRAVSFLQSISILAALLSPFFIWGWRTATNDDPAHTRRIEQSGP